MSLMGTIGRTAFRDRVRMVTLRYEDMIELV
jgi:hypothetical protein